VQTSRQVANQLLGPASWQDYGSRVALCAVVFGFCEYQNHPHPPYSPDPSPCDFFLFPKMKLKLKGDVLTALKRSRPYRRTWWRRWCNMTSRSASNRGSPAGIDVTMRKGTISKGMGLNRNFDKWLIYGRGVLENYCVAVVLRVATRIHNKSIQ